MVSINPIENICTSDATIKCNSPQMIDKSNAFDRNNKQLSANAKNKPASICVSAVTSSWHIASMMTSIRWTFQIITTDAVGTAVGIADFDIVIIIILSQTKQHIQNHLHKIQIKTIIWLKIPQLDQQEWECTSIAFDTICITRQLSASIALSR